MKTIAVLISLLAISGFVLFQNNQANISTHADESKIMKSYQIWKSEFGQNFNGASEDEYRFMEFKTNFIFIENHNTKTESLKLGLTKFAAMSNDEYRLNVLLRNKIQDRSDVEVTEAKGTAVPASIDWVTKGAVYTTQDQGSCGSCWAFATIGGLQGLMAINTGNLELLSAQQVTSCVDKQYLDNKNDGCGGGEARYAYAYTAEYGIESAAAYPYVDGNPLTKGTSPCNYNKEDVVFTNQGVGYVPANDVQAMKESLSLQPLSIAIDASSIYFQLYTSGTITTTNCGTELNHAILLVGYNTEASTPYWKVQNSWGTKWGMNGFGQFAIIEGDGVCGINMQVDYPTTVKQ